MGWGNERLIREWRVVNRHAADAMAEHDLSPADVKIVINSHLHFDHCGQNAVFKHAPFYVQRTELERARKSGDSIEWFDFAGARFELLDGDTEIAEGVRVVATPGHTSGHQSVFIDTADGEAVMIGDAAYTADIYTEVEDADLKQWPGQHEDREDWAHSLKKVHAMHPTRSISATTPAFSPAHTPPRKRGGRLVMFGPLVDAAWLHEHLHDPDVRVIDFRWYLSAAKDLGVRPRAHSGRRFRRPRGRDREEGRPASHAHPGAV